MPVDITQYRGSVGIFNNRNFFFRSKFSNFIGHKCWNSNQLYFKLYYAIFPMNLLLFLVFVIVLSPRISLHIINTGTSMLVINVALIFDYLCFKYNLLCYVAMLNSIQDPNRILQKKLLSATGTLIA